MECSILPPSLQGRFYNHDDNVGKKVTTNGRIPLVFLNLVRIIIMSNSTSIEWKSDFSSNEWDALLAEMGGHPLQSTLWGNARKQIEGIDDQRWAAYQNGQPIGLVRFELRGIGPIKKIAWIPQGPSSSRWKEIEPAFFAQLKKSGLMVCVTMPWERLNPNQATRHTIWIDLSLGQEKLWSNLDKQWRYGVRSAEKKNVQIESTVLEKSVAEFFKLCQQISDTKKFRLQGSVDFLLFLLKNSTHQGVEALLFVAKFNDKICGGAYIFRVGDNLHYMWGGVDRNYSKERVGELLQWKVIEWGCQHGCKLYDLEGIDEANNPGVAAFKKKMGGEVIGLPGRQISPLSFSGKLLARFLRG